MPRLARIRTTQLEDLAQQQRFTPERAILKQIMRAEALATELDAGQSYPEEWVVFRITGYRPDGKGSSSLEAALIPGAALIADLSAFVERLCDDAALDSSAGSETKLSAEQLCERWQVSQKTLERYRRMGLVARRLRDAHGHVRLAFSERAVTAFERVNQPRLTRAAGFHRIPSDVRNRMIARARRYRSRLGWTLNQTAGRLASRFGCGHETARQMLLRHDEHAHSPIFEGSPPLTVRDRRAIMRGYERGVPTRIIARRFGRSRASIHRAINQRRGERLRRLEQPSVVDPSFALPGVDRALLDRPGVRDGLGASFPSTPGECIATALTAGPGDPDLEHARAAAMHFLRWRARQGVLTVGRATPKSSLLDRAETDLRWSLRLRTELLRAEIPLIVRSIEERTRQSLSDMPPQTAMLWLSAAMVAAIAAIERHDPFRGGRVAAPVAIGLGRVLAVTPGVRDAKPPSGSDWSCGGPPGLTRFEPDGRLRLVLPMLPERDAELLALRYGWGRNSGLAAVHPMALSELQERTGATPGKIRGVLRRSLRLARTSSIGR